MRFIQGMFMFSLLFFYSLRLNFLLNFLGGLQFNS